MTNKVALITGSASGFGFRTALLFAKNGYHTCATVKNIHSTGAKHLQKLAKQQHLPLQVMSIDVSDDLSVQKGITAIVKKHKRIDVLVNNAGWSDKGPVEAYEIPDILHQYQTNIFGILRMIRTVAPIMRKQKTGHIINLSSVNGRIPFPMAGIYSSAKHAVEALTETLRFELSHFGIKVSMVEPGSFLTEGYERNFRPLHESTRKRIYTDLTTSYIQTLDATRRNAATFAFTRSIFNPQKVADIIFAISQKKHPRLRYRVGIDAHAYFLVKQFIPEQIWEWLLHKAYRW